MDAIQATRETLGLAHEILEATIGDCEPETLLRTFPGSTIGSIISIYMHAVSSEDWAIQELIQGKAKVFVTDKWSEKWSLPPLPQGDDIDWATANVPLAEVQKYAQAVYAATDAWLGTVTDASLDQQIDWFNGQKKTAAWVIAETTLTHVPLHAGEISSLKGLMGLKGLPW